MRQFAKNLKIGGNMSRRLKRLPLLRAAAMCLVALSASAAMPRRGSLLYKKLLLMIGAAVVALCGGWPMAALADLPSGYRQLDYVDTDGSTWVNTLYRPTCTNAVEIKAAIKDVSAWQCLYCTRRTGNNRTYTLLVNGATMKTRFDYKTTQITGDLTLTPGTPYIFAANPSEDDGQEEVEEMAKAWQLRISASSVLISRLTETSMLPLF